MAAQVTQDRASASPARPSIELLHSGASTPVMDDEDEDGETLESLMNKLVIEKRVQYGAEKMLDVIEQRKGDEGDQDQVKARIMAQLEAANDHVKALESRIDRLRGDTPQKHRRRPQRMTGYPSTSSLGQGLSSSASCNFLSNVVRPRMVRHGSSATPERERTATDYSESSRSAQGTPSKVRTGSSSTTGGAGDGRMGSHVVSRQRSQSLGESSDTRDPERGWMPGANVGPVHPMIGEHEDEGVWNDGEHYEVLVETVDVSLRRLKELARRQKRSRSVGPGAGGKGKSPERGDEPWDCMTRVADMVKKTPQLARVIDMDDVIQTILPYLADSATSRQRTSAYRLLRYSLNRASWGKMVDAGVEWILVRTFTRDAKAVHEREQALRLIRAVISLPPPPKGSLSSPSIRSRAPSERRKSRHSRGPSLTVAPDPTSKLLENRVPLTDGIVRALVSAAENPDDAMRTVCMQTLVEIGLLDLKCLLRSDAFRIILNTFKDGPLELGPGTTGLLLYLINQPSTRHLLVAGSDLEAVLVGLTEEYGKVSSRQLQRHLDKLQSCVRNVSLLLGSWSGLLYLCMSDFLAIKSLISALHVPMTEMRNALLDLFFSAFRIKPPTWTNAFLDGRRLTVYNRTQEASAQLQEGMDDDEEPPSLNLVDHFVAFLLAVFVEAGLVEALVSVIEEDNSALNRKATLLLGEILQLANRILPLQSAARLQALPKLFNGVAEFGKPSERNSALSALSSIDSLNRNQRRAGQATSRDKIAPTSTQDTLQRGQRQVQQVKLRLGLQVEDKQFQQMVNDSGVLLGRDHTKWNYEIIMDLLQGPLLNAKRLDEVMKATKFMRRLFSFFHPYNNRFSSIKRTRPNYKWVKLGCTLLSSMLVNPEGIKFMTEDKLLRQMVDCLLELDQYAGQPSSQPVFARDRLENSLTYGYFEMIGTLSKHREGMKLLEKFKFFTCFYHLSELRSRDDIIKLIIECFDYSIDAHQRIVLAKALTSSYMETRLFATHHVGRLLHDAPDLADWTLQLLITQLYDTAIEVCEIAVMYLEEACTDPANLDKVMQVRPTVEHLGDIGYPLFIRFMSTSVGFKYLHQARYIEREMETWLHERNLLYVIETETFVSKTVRPFTSDTIEDYWLYEGTAPTHFFGELSKTPEGCSYLKERGIVPEFCEIIRLHGMESEDADVMTHVKSMLWAVGNIGATEGGLPLLEDEEIIEVIIEVAEQSPALTMKGTCFFVLGLLSSTRMGAEILEEYGWVSTRTPIGKTTGLCLPDDISRFVHIESWIRPEITPTTPPLPYLTGLEGEIMVMISNLSNYVLAAGAMNNLKRVRTRHPRLFSSVTLFHRAIRLISTSHFQAPVRRFILDLFDVALEPETLVRLRHIEMSTYSTPPAPRPGGGHSRNPSANAEFGVNGNGNGNGNGNEGVNGGPEHDEHDPRPRAKSSPGPEPSAAVVAGVPGLAGRARGLTVSEMTPVNSSHFETGGGGPRPDFGHGVRA